MQNGMENISFRHTNIACPVTYASFSTSKLTVEWLWDKRPAARLSPAVSKGKGRGVPPAYISRPLSVSCRLPTRPSQGGPANFSQADFERQLRGPDYDCTQKVEPIRNGPNPIFDSYTIPRAALRSNFRIFSKFLLKFQNSITLLIMLRFSSGLF
jgi:hypothetical protein